jgi:hypothetical protein
VAIGFNVLRGNHPQAVRVFPYQNQGFPDTRTGEKNLRLASMNRYVFIFKQKQSGLCW